MTVSSTTARVSYSGNGSTTAFAVSFYFLASSHVKVTLRTASGTETVQVLGTHYTVTGAGNPAGGTVTMVTAPASGQTLVIQRNVPLTQEVDYQPNDPFPAESHEQALDKLTMEAQQLNEAVGRSIKLSSTNTMTSTEFTVGAADRSNKVLGFDSTGELSVTQELGTYRGNWAASTAYAQRDIIKDTSNANIYICLVAHTSSGSQPISTNTDSAKWALLVDAASATSSASAAASSASAAATSATNAASSASSASTSASNASTSATNAANSATNSANSATNSASSATAAAGSASAAATSATNAANSATSAANYVGNIINNPILGDDVFSGNGSTTVFTLSRSVTASTETALLVTIGGVVQAPTASYTASGTTLTFATAPSAGTNNIRVRYIGAMAVNASLASTAATNAATSATNASNSASAASTSASNASTSATNAANSASSASTSATNAASSASAASTSASNAASSASSASTSASSASSSATTATTQASAASTSATNAANSASSASTSATNASNSASSASTSATNAANSASSAAASLTSMVGAEIVMTIDGIGASLTAGKKGAIEIPFNCTINRWTITADQVGSVQIDINKSTYSGYPTTTSITASATPAISSAQKAQSSTLTGWTTSISAGDILEFEVDGTPSAITLATISLKVTKT